MHYLYIASFGPDTNHVFVNGGSDISIYDNMITQQVKHNMIDQRVFPILPDMEQVSETPY